MEIVLKSEDAAVEPAPDDAEAPHGAFRVILSTPTKDRDGEEVKSEEWEQLPDHITFDVDHGMSVAATVGSGKPEIDEGGRLVVAGTYASTPLAQQTRALVNEGHIRTTSVAFLRKSKPSDEKDGKPSVTRELLNGAFVAVPANREALVLSSKAATLVEPLFAQPLLAPTTDKGAAQQIHDAMLDCGATCKAAHDDEKPTTPETPADDAASVAAVQSHVLLSLRNLRDFA